MEKDVNGFRSMKCADHLNHDFETAPRVNCEAACESKASDRDSDESPPPVPGPPPSPPPRSFAPHSPPAPAPIAPFRGTEGPAVGAIVGVLGGVAALILIGGAVYLCSDRNGKRGIRV